MGRTPRVDAAKVSGTLKKHGYVPVRQSGSHRIYKNPDGIRITVPIHSGKIIHPKILNKISEDTGIPLDEFR
ncbi:type II toxin-antitoxin system HicA family toxin [Methanoplanus limicola]|uniref:YcfA family protein n=1 Tax=Methanoplanus limicola DSM 2279 TaxID=937775 RepID=H1YZX2_9EURY|nr:type II toxin-antitoxin system HicA family toxin [Methanoplanus limicola]EHQ35179.1 YcfA family protein [Methanoplanus limicola DSM 2279]